MSNQQITFHVHGTVHQEIRLHDDESYTPEKFAQALAEERILTALGHTAGEAVPVYELNGDSLTEIGHVIHQISEGDMLFSNFVLQPQGEEPEVQS